MGCKATECERPAKSYGLCGMHYMRAVRSGSLDRTVPRPSNVAGVRNVGKTQYGTFEVRVRGTQYGTYETLERATEIARRARIEAEEGDDW